MAYKASGDRVLFITTSLITIFGVVMVYSASSALASDQHGSTSYFFTRQLIFAVIGFGAMLTLMNLNYHFWQRRLVLAIVLVLCAAGLSLAFTQPTINGAQRWLRYCGGLISFQPSEFAKLGVIMFLAAFLHRYENEINRWSRLVPCVGVVALIGGLIIFEPDFGQAICLAVIAAALLFTAGLAWRHIALAGALSAPALCIAIILRLDRFRSFLDPNHDPNGAGWHILQSLRAIGSGGIFGVGLGASKQKLFFLPEAHSDFIFAVIGEELGLIGTSLVCLAFLVYFWRGLRITLRAPDPFGFYLGFGITLMVILQAFINISMVLALMPTKGIALPFISQGGSSLLLNLVSTGILLNISHHSEKA